MARRSKTLRHAAIRDGLSPGSSEARVSVLRSAGRRVDRARVFTELGTVICGEGRHCKVAPQPLHADRRRSPAALGNLYLTIATLVKLSPLGECVISASWTIAPGFMSAVEQSPWARLSSPVSFSFSVSFALSFSASPV